MEPGSGSGIPIDYEPGFQWHSYSIQVRGNVAQLLDAGSLLVFASSNVTDTLSNGPLGIISSQVVLRISSLRILSA